MEQVRRLAPSWVGTSQDALSGSNYDNAAEYAVIRSGETIS
jgi:hypothetical protein